MNVREILEGWGKLTAIEVGILKASKKGANRLITCLKCPLFSDSGTCTICNCVMKAKVLVETASCPNGKW